MSGPVGWYAPCSRRPGRGTSSAPSRSPPSWWPFWPLWLWWSASWVVWRDWARRGAVTNPNAAPRPVTARGDLAEGEKANIKIYKEVSPSVVHVTSLELVQGGLFNLNAQEVPRGTGSGFIWDQD